jgi:hypothetical protein
LSKKGWFTTDDVTYQKYNGLTSGYNLNYFLWNMSVGKKILKKQAGEIKLTMFDILKQNTSISRTVTAAYIEDVRNEVLQQYVMLTFTYRFKNFGTPPKQTNIRESRYRAGNNYNPEF